MREELLASRVRRFGIALICAKVVLVPLVFDPAADAPFPVAKALLSHALAYALVGVLVGLFVRFGRSLIVRSRVHLAVLAFLAVNVAATIFAVDHQLALYGAHFRMLGLGTIADWAVLYFAVALLLRTRLEQLAVLAAIAVASLGVLAYEAVQLAGRDPIQWSIASNRAFSTLGQPTVLGAYLVTVASGVAAFAIFEYDLRRWQRATLLTCALVLLLGASASGTRSILLGATAALAFFILVAFIRSTSFRGRLIGAAVAAIGVSVLITTLIATPLGSRVLATVAGVGTEDVEVDPSTAGRLDLYRMAIGMVAERPLLGYGPDSFVAGVPLHRPEDATLNIRRSLPTSGHSWVTYVATSSGLAGLAAFLVLLGIAAGELMRHRSRSPALVGGALAIAMLGVGLTTVNDVSTDWLLWVGIGLIGAGTPSDVSEAPAKTRGRRMLPRSRHRDASFVAVALGAAAMLLSLGAWGASRSAETSTGLRQSRQVESAIVSGRSAVDADPGRAAYWHTLGLAYVAAGRFTDADSAFASAARLAPYDIAHLNDQVQSQLALATGGDRDATGRALALSDEAVRIDPNNPAAHELRAATLQYAGEMEGAEREIRRALALDPDSRSDQLYVTALHILTMNGHRDDGIDIARARLRLISGPAVNLRLEVSRALVTAERWEEAAGELDLLLERAPDLEAARRLREEVRAHLGR